MHACRYSFFLPSFIPSRILHSPSPDFSYLARGGRDSALQFFSKLIRRLPRFKDKTSCENCREEKSQARRHAEKRGSHIFTHAARMHAALLCRVVRVVSSRSRPRGRCSCPQSGLRTPAVFRARGKFKSSDRTCSRG